MFWAKIRQLKVIHVVCNLCRNISVIDHLTLTLKKFFDLLLMEYFIFCCWNLNSV